MHTAGALPPPFCKHTELRHRSAQLLGSLVPPISFKRNAFCFYAFPIAQDRLHQECRRAAHTFATSTVEPPGPNRGPMDRGRSSGASSRFIAFVARGARIHGAGLHLLATRQRAVPRGRSWEKIRKESRPYNSRAVSHSRTCPVETRLRAYSRRECSHSRAPYRTILRAGVGNG
jgi:hypothetical protein